MRGSQPEVELVFEDLTRRFGRRVVFKEVSGKVRNGESLVITGPNGSGKSTLLKIVTGLLSPSSGRVTLSADGVPLESAARRSWMGYVAPDLTLYGELTGAENLEFFGRLRGLSLSREELIASLDTVGLKGRGRDLVRDYSSGMRQRLKYAFALLGSPPVLILDEPTANLDADGAAIVYDIIQRQRTTGFVVIGTNESRELAWGDAVIQLEGSHVPSRS